MVSSIRRHTTSLSVERKMTRGETPRNPSTDEDPEKVSEKAACGSPDLRYHGDVPAFGPKPSQHLLGLATGVLVCGVQGVDPGVQRPRRDHLRRQAGHGARSRRLGGHDPDHSLGGES